MKAQLNFGRWVSCILTAPILQTTDLEYAEKSIFQWRSYSNPDSNIYTTSILGLINGWLPKIGLLLVSEQPTDVTSLTGWKVRLRKQKDVVFTNKEL